MAWRLVKKTTKNVFQNRVARSTGEVSWRQRGGSPIPVDCWKAQSVYSSNMHRRARLSYTNSERSDRHGSEVDIKNNKKNFQNKVAKSTGGVTWRHRGFFPTCLGRRKAQLSSFQICMAFARLIHSGLEGSDGHGLEVAQKR